MQRSDHHIMLLFSISNTLEMGDQGLFFDCPFQQLSMASVQSPDPGYKWTLYMRV